MLRSRTSEKSLDSNVQVCLCFLPSAGHQAGVRARSTVPLPAAPLGLTFRPKKRSAKFSPTRCSLESLACDRSVGFLWGILLLLPIALGVSGCGLRFTSSASNSGPPANLTVANVTDLGTIPTNPDILGRDGGYSTVFQGYSVWLYGDTFLAVPNAEDFTLISDSWSYTKDLNAQNGITGFQERLDSVGAPTMILPETPDEQAYNTAHNGNKCQQQPCGARLALWPGSIVVDPVSGNALIFYSLVSALPGNFSFQAVGNSVATWQSIPISYLIKMSRILARPRSSGEERFTCMAATRRPTAATRGADSARLTLQVCSTGAPGPFTATMAIGLHKLAMRSPSLPATTSLALRGTTISSVMSRSTVHRSLRT